MKNPVLSKEEGKKLLYKCTVCGEPVDYWYGRWGDKGTCDRICEQIQEDKPKYPPSTLGDENETSST